MNFLKSTFGVLIIAVLLLPGYPLNAQESPGAPKENIIMLFSTFEGDERFSSSLANLVRLQISSTFREADTGNRGRMIWSETPLTSHEESRSRALRLENLAHVVTWGDVYLLQDGVALQQYLSVSELFWRRGSNDSPPPGVWQIPVPSTEKPNQSIILGLPRNLFRLPAVLYSSEAAARYDSLDGLPIYSDTSFSEVIGRTQKLFRAFRYTDNAVNLTSGGVNGWVPLDYVSEENNIAVQFSSAVFRTIRGDYSGVRENLEVVLESKQSDLMLRTDALLLFGLSLELEGRSGLRYFSAARELLPLDSVVARYYLSGLVREISRADDNEELVKLLETGLQESERLFDPDSSWYGALREHSLEIIVQ